jgi:hypothetical protein
MTQAGVSTYSELYNALFMNSGYQAEPTKATVGERWAR